MNDLLSSGEIADLFNQEDKDNIVGSLRNKVKAQGLDSTFDGCMKYFID